MGQIWLERLIRFQKKYQQVMRGRYGRFDQLNRAILIAALFFSLISPWLPYGIGRLLFLALIGLLAFRFLSKKIYPRLNENQRYLSKADTVKKWFQRFTNKNKRPNDAIRYIYFECPACHQKQRAPQGRGKIRVTCKSCGTRFETKV
ncbi:MULTISPECIES: hypothetical protein [unclassified Enterococcus]|uniref:hypothetical protein n=1 Tax=unclassified Enterococcus TaxID=2608891 RepID=UPI0013EA4CFC|nr:MULTISPECIES: hypothetical protein [unclassified Enterococcus]